VKAELEVADIEAIAKKVAELVGPLVRNCNGKEQDTIFDVSGLARYLKVDKSWVYNQVHLKNIPYFKCGKYTRFKKSAIDKWIAAATVNPLPAARLQSKNPT
jgi:excisionase family DNA binding protein